MSERFIVPVGSVGEFKVKSKKLWLLERVEVETMSSILGQGLIFLGQRKFLESYSMCADSFGTTQEVVVFWGLK